jgi:hypothetical protein
MLFCSREHNLVGKDIACNIQNRCSKRDTKESADELRSADGEKAEQSFCCYKQQIFHKRRFKLKSLCYLCVVIGVL